MCTLRIKALFFNITFICVQEPTEEADDEDKEKLYEKLKKRPMRVPGHNAKIILGDTIAKIGKEIVEGTVCIMSATTTERGWWTSQLVTIW
jgi:hypothetical protein